MHHPRVPCRTVAVVLLAIGALAIATGAAIAQPTGHIAMRWNDCYGDGGASLRAFACNTNVGSEGIVVSAFPPVAMPQLIGAELVIDIMTDGPPLPSWWQFQPAGCRAGNALASFIRPSSSVSCIDPWLGVAVGGQNFIYPFGGNPNWGRLLVLGAVAVGVPVAAGAEIFLALINVAHAKTVGTGSCSGCAGGLCIGLNSVKLTQPVGVGDHTIIHPLPATASDAVAWQQDMVMSSFFHPGHGGGPLVKDFVGCVSATDAARPTWGAIKRLYR